MFRSFIYLDTEKLNVYKKILEGKQNPKLRDITRKKGTAIKVEMGSLEVSGQHETEVRGEFEYNDEVEYDNFEKALEDLDGEEYFDCVLKDYDISTVSAMNLARLSGCITIPESFDVVNLIGLFKPLLLKMVDDRIEDDKVESVRNILSSAKADIPIIIEDNDIAIVSKLKSNFLREDIESLEDYAEQEVFLLCKVIGRIDTKNIEIFDPLKDFIKLPRQARKAVEKDMAKTNLKKIYVEGPVLRAEIIAIYK